MFQRGELRECRCTRHRAGARQRWSVTVSSHSWPESLHIQRKCWTPPRHCLAFVHSCTTHHQSPGTSSTMATQAASAWDSLSLCSSRSSLLNLAGSQGVVFTKLGMGGGKERAATGYPELRKGLV